MRPLALALLLLAAGCTTAPPEIQAIHKAAQRDWLPSTAEFYDPGCSGKYTGDCSSFAARVECLATQAGLETDSKFVWKLGQEPHQWTTVRDLSGKWWSLDNRYTNPLEGKR